ncbi:hypothetical protein ABZ890_12070 [Streptomyces sp. NPDC046984]|uniref:hypothetical protein n=1 Tax=Streptomyces sp. NPDC046984 TaxID=3155138 RepID=UPI0033D6BBC7
MHHLPALTCEPRHPRGGAAGAAPAETIPPWHGQKVRVSKRLWGHGTYSHGAIRYAAQIAALDQRTEGCRAGVMTLARLLGDSKRTAERYLAELAAQAPDGHAEMRVIRHTDPGGRGTTAERRMRNLARGEHYAYVDICAAKTLRPAAFVAYCAITYAQAVNTPWTAAELGALLGVTERTARRLIGELEALGWICVDRRAGYQGRHVITVADCPGHDRPQTPGPDTEGGSGPDHNGGSLAIKEDPELTDGRSTQERGSFRRRRGTGSRAVDTGGNAVGGNYPVSPVASVAPATFRPAAPHRLPYNGPPLTLSRRVWRVLTPVADLLPEINPYLVRRIGREVGRHLDAGVLAEDLRDQLRTLRAWTPSEDIRDPGRWILGAALPVRPGKCGTTDCIRGFQRFTGAPCKACAELAAARARAAHPPHTAWRECTDCGKPSRQPFPSGLCRACQPVPSSA